MTRFPRRPQRCGGRRSSIFRLRRRRQASSTAAAGGKPHAARRPGDDHIVGVERGERRAIFDPPPALKISSSEVACWTSSPLIRVVAQAIEVRSLGGISGVRPHLPLLQYNFNHHTLVSQRKVYLPDQPRCLQSKKLFVQRRVFHVLVDRFEKPDSARSREKSQWN